MEYFPETNRIAERCNRFILKRANVIRFGVGLPGLYWETALYMCNLSQE